VRIKYLILILIILFSLSSVIATYNPFLDEEVIPQKVQDAVDHDSDVVELQEDKKKTIETKIKIKKDTKNEESKPVEFDNEFYKQLEDKNFQTTVNKQCATVKTWERNQFKDSKQCIEFFTLNSELIPTAPNTITQDTINTLIKQDKEFKALQTLYGKTDDESKKKFNTDKTKFCGETGNAYPLLCVTNKEDIENAMLGCRIGSGDSIQKFSQSQNYCNDGVIETCLNGQMIQTNFCGNNGCQNVNKNAICNGDQLYTCKKEGDIACFPNSGEFKFCKEEGKTNFWATANCRPGYQCNKHNAGTGCCKLVFDDKKPKYECYDINKDGTFESEMTPVDDIDNIHKPIDPGISALWRKSSIGQSYNNLIDEIFENSFFKNLNPEYLICNSKANKLKQFGKTVGNVQQFLSTKNFNVHWDGSYSPLYQEVSLYTLTWSIKANEVPKNLESNKKINGAVCYSDEECLSNDCNLYVGAGEKSNSGFCQGTQETIKTKINQAVVFLLGDLDVELLQTVANYINNPSKKLPADYGDIPLKIIEFDNQKVFSADLDKPLLGTVEFESDGRWNFVCLWFIPSHVNNQINTKIIKPGLLGCQPIVNRDLDPKIETSSTSTFSNSDQLYFNQNNKLFNPLNSVSRVIDVNDFLINENSNKPKVVETINTISKHRTFFSNGRMIGWPMSYNTNKEIIKTFNDDFEKAQLIPNPISLADVVNNYFYFAVKGRSGTVSINSEQLSGLTAEQVNTISNPDMILRIEQKDLQTDASKLKLKYDLSFSKKAGFNPMDIKIQLYCTKEYLSGHFNCPKEDIAISKNIYQKTLNPGESLVETSLIIEDVKSNQMFNQAKLIIDGQVEQTSEIISMSLPPFECIKNQDNLFTC